jgi:parvulin-like peptidyl-prolyl isomerase
MVPAFSDAAFSAKKGEIVGPVKSSFGYHLIKVEDRKTEDGEEKVKASHILLKIAAGPSTVEEQNSKARYFTEDAKLDGFESVAQREGMEIRKTGLIQETIGFVPGFGRSSGVLNFAFSSELGAVSDVFSTDEGYAVVMLSEIQEEGYRPVDAVRAAIESRIRLDRAKEKARAFAITLSEEVKNNTPFKDIADADTGNTVTYMETGLFTITQSLTGVGRFAEFSANAFAMDVGERSGLIETERGFYYQQVLEKTEFDSSAFETQKNGIRTRLLNEKKNRVFAEWYEALKEDATIVDNRRQFGLL